MIITRTLQLFLVLPGITLTGCSQPDPLTQTTTEAEAEAPVETPVAPKPEPAHDPDRAALAHARLHGALRLQLLQNLGADALDIDIDIVGGDVVLKGKVSREALKLAPVLARQVAGVDHVKSELELSDDADKGASAVGASIDDSLNNTGIGLKLLDAVGNHALKIKVKVAGDTAVLSGTVPSEAVRADALRAAADQNGIASVLDELVIE